MRFDSEICDSLYGAESLLRI